MIDQTLTTPPDAPSSNDIPTFRTRFDAFIAWIVTFVSQLTTVISQINSTASTINSKESSATSAASTATTQAGIATTKAGEASASATAAYNAQLAAEAVFDNFDDKYLGAKAIAPTVDNDGNPLVTGALFFKTTAPKGIYVYDAELSAWSIFSYIPTSHGTLSGRSDADSHPMSAIAGLVEALADKLSKTLDASIDGIKTFLKFPITPSSAPTADYQVANRKFVTDLPLSGLIQGIKVGNTALADATTLDWYEEGTFTPIIFGSTTSGTGTYTSQLGKYTRIGNTVHCELQVIVTAHTGTGAIRIGGLPFTTSPSYFGSATIAYASNLTFSGLLGAYLTLGVTSINLMNYSSGGAVSSVPIDTSFELIISCTYQV